MLFETLSVGALGSFPRLANVSILSLLIQVVFVLTLYIGDG
jgi:hypothetical protein